MRPMKLIRYGWYIPAFNGVPRDMLSRSTGRVVRVSDFIWNRMGWARLVEVLVENVENRHVHPQYVGHHEIPAN